MNNYKYIEKNLKNRFGAVENFTREDLLNFYHLYDPQINEGTFGWKIYDLKKKQIIETVKKGVYTLVKRKTFKPELDRTILKVAHILENSFSVHFYNIWNTSWLNEFIELQATSSIIILETDKDSMEGVFYQLKDKNMTPYLKPDDTVIERYLAEEKEAVVVKPMISRAPTHRLKNTVIPSLEKILVDLYCDEKLFFAYQGQQLERIYAGSFEKYIINLSRLLNYAKRRGRQEDIKSFLLSNLPENIKSLIE